MTRRRVIRRTTVGTACALLTWSLGLAGQPVPRVAVATMLDQPGASILRASASPSRRVLRRPGPFAAIDRGAMLAALTDLTGIRPYAMWRTAGSRGEAEARAWLRARLASLASLTARGMTVTEQPFRTFLAGDIWTASLELTVGGRTIAVPAQGLQGHRELLDQALRFDSDGTVNDTVFNPVVRSARPLLLRSMTQLRTLTPATARERISFLDYALVDRSIVSNDVAGQRASDLLAKDPQAVVLVTTFSNVAGQSHGTFAGDVSSFVSMSGVPAPPILLVRMEDVVAAGISGWTGLGSATSARVTWDADVYSPGASANVIARIPGVDRSLAVILGAHLDSANTPGALDDGSGSIVLLEVARVLDASGAVPPVDLVLVWYGSHERGLYGSGNFVVAHPDVLDQALAVLQTDCLSRPLDGISGRLSTESWSYTRFGATSLPWPEYLRPVAGAHGAWPEPLEVNALVSDNSSYNGHDVPNANLILLPWTNLEPHYAGHMHDPYDTVALAAEEAETLEHMAVTALAAGLTAGLDRPMLHVTPPPTRRAVFVASHTEPPHMSPVSFTELGMALTWEGFDVDIVPYGRAVTASDLAGADLVIALPAIDYPLPALGNETYDEAYSSEEVAVLEGYARGGGHLVVTASAHRLKYSNYVYEENEDTLDVNSLAGRFGVAFTSGAIAGNAADTVGDHALVAGVNEIELADGNAVPFTAAAAQVLARLNGQSVVALVSAGAGEVLVLADLGILGTAQPEAPNLRFWRNLAAWAAGR